MASRMERDARGTRTIGTMHVGMSSIYDRVRKRESQTVSCSLCAIEYRPESSYEATAPSRYEDRRELYPDYQTKNVKSEMWKRFYFFTESEKKRGPNDQDEKLDV